jgi:hypothetical protein
MQEYIGTKGPLSIFRYQWIAKAFTKDIVGNMPMKTDNWLDEIIYNPPELNLVYTIREFQPYEEEYEEKHFCFLGPSVYERKEQCFRSIGLRSTNGSDSVFCRSTC